MAEFNLCIGMLAILCGLASMGERTAPLDYNTPQKLDQKIVVNKIE